MDLAYPQRSPKRGQGCADVYASLEIGENLDCRLSRRALAPIAYYLLIVAVYGEFDGDQRSLPTIQHSRPKNQFLDTSNCPTRRGREWETFGGINGINGIDDTAISLTFRTFTS